MGLRSFISNIRFKAKALKEDRAGATFVRVDASSTCQLKCPVCPTSRGENRKGIIGWGHLRPEDFTGLLENNPGIRKVELSNWGEIFLNPRLREIIRYARKRGVELRASNGSNLNAMDEETAECLVKYGFGFLSVSLDGASNETYSLFRRGGDLNKAIESVRLINRYKREYKSEFPRLRWQFIVFGHNEHEIAEARRMAGELGMEFYAKLNYDPEYSPVRDPETVKRSGGIRYASRAEFMRKKKKEYAMPCTQLWFSPQINWDGKLLGCCANTFSDFGNVFHSGLGDCLRGERYSYAKRMLMGKAGLREDIACARCRIYLSSRGPVARMF
jgi:MoaA/NifB/PqqE/SkfB family radical SAM enzyme